MPITKLQCPTCRGPATLSTEFFVGQEAYKTYICGHTDVVRRLDKSDFSDFVSLDNKRPYPFQIEGAVFASETANGRFLIMDEMGLGKTVQALMTIKSHERELTKFIILCKAGLKAQWSREVTRWCGEDWITQTLESERDYLIPGVKGYILSFDTLWRFRDIEGFVKRAKIKFAVIDEVQHIKNTDSKRTNGVRTLCKSVPYVGGLSGTPIKNHAGEFFPVLNILRPDIYEFTTKARFDQTCVDTYYDGYKLKYGGLKNAARFKALTESFIIRRTRAEVLPDLPTISRDFRFSELGPVVENAYKDTLKQFQQYYLYSDDTAAIKSANVLAYLTKMRHLTGIAKIEPCIDFVQDFIQETDRKLVIFAHHKDVRKILYEKLEELRATEKWPMSPILLMPEDVAQRSDVIEAFKRPEYRVLIASTLASSEGLNLQFCSDCVVLERQWNPANEEQAESRFIRIGQLANKVSSTYMVAIGTVDEFFATLVEKKREVVTSALDGKEIRWEESSLIKELAEILAVSGGKKWGW